MSLELCDNVRLALEQTDNGQALKMIRAVITSERIFVVGTGRSALVGKFFARRLVDLTLDAYVVGETITPASRVTDCIVAISGSGESTYTLNTVEIGKNVGAKVVAITTYPESALGSTADTIIVIPGRLLEVGTHQDFLIRQIRGSSEVFSPHSGVFELTTAIFLETVVRALGHKMRRRQS